MDRDKNIIHIIKAQCESSEETESPPALPQPAVGPSALHAPNVRHGLVLLDSKKETAKSVVTS